MKKSMTMLALLGVAATLPAFGSSLKGEARDAWIQGKIETVYLLNANLSSFSIDTDVKNGAVHLTGKVESSIDHDLAGELAKGIDGVVSVDNDLIVDATARSASKDGRSFAGWVEDATTTATIKSKLLSNSNTHGLKIDVDTRADVVTLSGTVTSAEEKQLAEQLARNSADVKDVQNRLVVQRSN
jgi:hyperosmotically inducible periplasmic protein